MTPEDRQAIINAVNSFRPAAPINIFDVRLAAGRDGHSLSALDSKEIARVLTDIAVSKKMGYISHTYWVRAMQ